jgi:hypothetical protein
VIEVIRYLLCTAGGVAIGYYFAHARLEEDFRERLDRETDEARDFYRRKYMDKAKEEGEDPGLTEAAIKTAESLRESYAGVSIGPDVLTQEMSATVKRAVERGDLTASEEEPDQKTDDAWDLARKAHEAQKRMDNPLSEQAVKPTAVNYNRISTPSKTEEVKTAEEPKAEEAKDEVQVDDITKQAFIDNEFGYEQQSLTYFAGDDVLTNEEDEPITGSRDILLGAVNAKKIKVGLQAMGGKDTIYVRNHTAKWEFEVTRSEGNFSDEVQAKSG